MNGFTWNNITLTNRFTWQTSLGRTGLLGIALLRLLQTSLERIDMLELIFLRQAGLLR